MQVGERYPGKATHQSPQHPDPESFAPSQKQKDYYHYQRPAQEEVLWEQRLEDDGMKGNGCLQDPGLGVLCPTRE